MRQVGRHGIAQVLMSGHGKPPHACLPSPAPAGLTPCTTHGLESSIQLPHSAARRAEGLGQQYWGVARPTHPHQPNMAATHRQEDLRYGAEVAAAAGVEGLLPLERVQPRPTALILNLAWWRTPLRGTLYLVSFITTFKPYAWNKIKNCKF
jgi:hypothetical protein